MSVYGGFATRQQEHIYNALVERSLKLLIERYLHDHDYHEHPLLTEATHAFKVERWEHKMRKIFNMMRSMDK